MTANDFTDQNGSGSGAAGTSTGAQVSTDDADRGAEGRVNGDTAHAEPVDLQISSEPFEITSELVAANLFASAHDAIELPEEMKSTVERIWRDAAFTWPTTISVTRITLSVDETPGADQPQSVYSRVSVIGTGWDGDRPVALKWNNAFGFPGASINLPDAQPTSTGFFGVDLILKTTPRKHAEFVWESNNQLVLVAQQKADSGQITRQTEQRALPPHIVWQWVR